jgi:hypothetical protein
MESFKASNANYFLGALEFPDDDLGYFTVDKVDPSTVYHNKEDKMYLKSLSELQQEAIIAEHLDKAKKVAEMKRALAHAVSRHLEGTDDRIYVPPLLRAPDHHAWPFFRILRWTKII